MPTASLLPLPRFVAYDQNGNPLSGGLVTTQVAGGGPLKSTFQDAAETIPNANPATLDADGSMLMYAEGALQIITTDALGNQVPAYSGLVSATLQSGIFALITDLRSNALVVTAPYEVEVTGYYAPGDAGAGEFIFLPGDTTTPDDGGFTIVDAAGQRWRRETNGMPINIRWLGARGDNVTDDTAAVQATVNAAGVAGSVFVQAGTYIVSATITCLVNQEIIGEGPNSSIFQRYADYGDTFVFPTSFACRVSKIWCRQGTPYGTTDNSLSNIIHTPSAHIRLQNAQGVVIEDCWLWRMPYQIVIEDGALVKIHRCNIQGTWDGNFAAAQEGVAGVWVGSVAYTQIVAIEHCYFGGSGNGPRTVGWTSTDTGLHTFNIVQNCGNQYAILVYRCEDFLLSNTYMGGNWLSNFAADPTAGTVNLDWRFIGNFFDGSGAQSPMMNFLTQIDGNWVNSVTISGNVFNGEEQTLHAIQAFNPTGGIIQTLAEFTITGNTFQATVGTALNILNAQGGTISGNTIVGYNCRNVSNIDLGFVAGIFIGPQCHFILSSGNLVGGQVNTVGVPSFTYSAVVISQLSQMCVEKHTLSIGTGGAGNLVGKVDAYVITKRDAGNYTCVGNEDILILNKTVPQATDVGLPTNVPTGQMMTVKDGKGDASINGFHLVGTVDGAVNPFFNTNYISVTVVWNGTEWSTVGTA